MGYFITGTGTDAGKTHVTCLLLRALVQQGRRACGFKPVASGGRADAEALLAAGTAGPSLDQINPCWFRVPLAPLAASKIEGHAVNLDAITRAYFELSAHYAPILVEGAGGWETPIAAGKTMADLAVLLGLPVLIVGDNKLGALNHLILTARAVRSRGLTCAGIVLNHPQEERDAASISNRAVLAEVLDVPVVAEVMHGETHLTWPEELPL